MKSSRLVIAYQVRRASREYGDSELFLCRVPSLSGPPHSRALLVIFPKFNYLQGKPKQDQRRKPCRTCLGGWTCLKLQSKVGWARQIWIVVPKPSFQCIIYGFLDRRNIHPRSYCRDPPGYESRRRYRKQYESVQRDNRVFGSSLVWVIYITRYYHVDLSFHASAVCSSVGFSWKTTSWLGASAWDIAAYDWIPPNLHCSAGMFPTEADLPLLNLLFFDVCLVWCYVASVSST